RHRCRNPPLQHWPGPSSAHQSHRPPPNEGVFQAEIPVCSSNNEWWSLNGLLQTEVLRKSQTQFQEAVFYILIHWSKYLSESAPLKVLVSTDPLETDRPDRALLLEDCFF